MPVVIRFSAPTGGSLEAGRCLTDTGRENHDILREVQYETPNGGRLRFSIFSHEILDLLATLDAAHSRAADASLRLPPERLRSLIVQWLIENADGCKRSTREVVEGVLGRSLSSTKEPERRDYLRFFYHLRNVADEVARRGYDLVESPEGEAGEKQWWVQRRATT